MKKSTFIVLSLSFFLSSVTSQACIAQDKAPIPGFTEGELPKEPQAMPASTIQPASTTQPQQTPSPVTQTELQTDTTSTLPPEPELHVKDGPLMEARLDLLKTINLAKENGIGITNYMRAFDYIEDMAAKGQAESDMQKRVDSLKAGIEEQMKRSTQIKTEAAATATATSSRKLGPGNLIADPFKIPEAYRSPGGAHSKELLDTIMLDKLGGRLPTQMTKAEIHQKIKEMPELEEYLKKYK